jgi:hypothetical protein
LYLPLYNSPESLEIGVEAGATVEPLPKRQEKPIVVYGTSIMHGASAARCGMAFPAQLGRRLGTPVINLGFAGNGRMHPEVVDLLAEFDPSVLSSTVCPTWRLIWWLSARSPWCTACDAAMPTRRSCVSTESAP